MKRFIISMASIAAFIIPEMSCRKQPPQAAPDKDAVAVVLGKRIDIKDKDNLKGLILDTLLERYAKENMIEPTKAELDAFVKKIEDSTKLQQIRYVKEMEKLAEELKSSSLTEQERKEKTSKLQMLENSLKRQKEVLEDKSDATGEKMQTARHFVRSWKINKSLYEKYGGRIILQQFGPEPLDAYREFLKEKQKEGSFKIYYKDSEMSFWKYFADDSMHTFYPGEDGAKLMETPWWMTDKSAGR